MLCKNCPFGRINFLILSADADAKECLRKDERTNLAKTVLTIVRISAI